MRTVINTLCICVVLVFSATVHGGNYDFTPRMSAKSLALNGMYTAGSDGLANMITNPAGLGMLKTSSLELGFLDRTGQQDYQHPEDGLYRTYRDDDIGIAIGGHWKFNQELTLAAMYTNPVKYNVDWPYARYFQEGTTSLVSTFDMQNKLSVGGFSIAGAYNLDKISFGATINFLQYQSTISFPVLNDIWYDYVEIEPGYQVSYDQDVWQLGFNLGVNLDITDELRCGIVFRSSQDLTFEGLATSALPAAFARVDTNESNIPAGTDDISMNAALPVVIGGGILYRITESMHINADMALHMWGSLDKIWTVEFTDAQWRDMLSVQDNITGITPNKVVSPDQNGLEAGVGFEYVNESGPDFRFGYRYSQSPLSSGAISMFFPECDQHWFSFGVNLQGDGYETDLAIAYALGTSNEVSPAENNFNYGSYKSDLLIAGITFRYGL